MTLTEIYRSCSRDFTQHSIYRYIAIPAMEVYIGVSLSSHHDSPNGSGNRR
jgi:hypothetical protein